MSGLRIPASGSVKTVQNSVACIWGRGYCLRFVKRYRPLKINLMSVVNAAKQRLKRESRSEQRGAYPGASSLEEAGEHLRFCVRRPSAAPPANLLSIWPYIF